MPFYYFDYAATTPCDPRVIAQLTADLRAPLGFANCGATYPPALENRQKLAAARETVAAIIGADAREIVFTSGATEANNLALKGALTYHGNKLPHLITLQTEHKAVLDPAAILAKQGVKVTVLPVLSTGKIDFAALDDALLHVRSPLVSVMAVNNETGVIQPIADIAERVHAAGGKIHVDAAQALGKLPINNNHWQADLISFSGHKIYAPKGIGALYVRRLPKMRLQAQLQGGGQERGLRSGTSPLELIRAFSLAAELAEKERAARWEKITQLEQLFWQHLPAHIHNNIAAESEKVPHIQNINIGQSAQIMLQKASQAGFALSAGSACQAGTNEGSHVLRAMGLTAALTSSLRISFSHLTTADEVVKLATFLNQTKEIDNL